MSIILAFIVFSVLILIHEFGHFLLAKKNGICVTEFSLGMGPRIVSFVKGETRYSWKLIPFGGSCMMLGEDTELEDGQDPEKSFESKGVWARISVILAGPVFNFLLAFVLSLIVIGFVGSDTAKVLEVEKGSPAEVAGLKEGDVITKYNGASISLGREIILEQFVHPTDAGSIDLVVKRGEEKVNLTITPEQRLEYYLGLSYTGDSASKVEIKVTKDGALDKAGVENKDELISINGIEIKSGIELRTYLEQHPLTAEAVTLVLRRDGEDMTFTVSPLSKESYYVGYSFNTGREKMSGLNTIKYSGIEIKYQIKTVFKSLGMLVTGKVKKNDMAGPVGIVDIISSTVNDTKSDGWFMVFLNLANLTVLLSANLGVMNLLPFPALDGGRLVFLIIELVRGKPIAKEKEGMVHFVGMILLMLLMVFVLYNDITKLFTK